MTKGEQIKQVRKDMKLTQRLFGEKCNISEAMIRQYELGLRQPKIETLRKMAKNLQIGLEVFLTEDEQSLSESMANLYLKSDDDIKELKPPNEYNSQENYLMMKFRELNEKGRNKVVDYADDLSKTEEYLEKEEN